jgi:hypothetical protein
MKNGTFNFAKKWYFLIFYLQNVESTTAVTPFPARREGTGMGP